MTFRENKKILIGFVHNYFVTAIIDLSYIAGAWEVFVELMKTK